MIELFFHSLRLYLQFLKLSLFLQFVDVILLTFGVKLVNHFLETNEHTRLLCNLSLVFLLPPPNNVDCLVVFVLHLFAFLLRNKLYVLPLVHHISIVVNHSKHLVNLFLKLSVLLQISFEEMLLSFPLLVFVLTETRMIKLIVTFNGRGSQVS